MYSDTHFHFAMACSRAQTNGAEILQTMASRACFFALDIGTKAGDITPRKAALDKAISSVDESLREKARAMIYYSAGIWPAPEAIKARTARMAELEASINNFNNSSERGRIVAIGEGGVDRHWNPTGADERSADDFDDAMCAGERELFEMQLALAKRLNLPMIVHSRDAFDETFACIKNSGYDKGIIHCYSYGLSEAKQFLERGWHISFSGSVTYTKRSKAEAMDALLRYIPADRILCETDAPYLAPVPHRGEPNSPVYVEYIYRYIAEKRGIRAEKLCEIVDENCKTLFGV